MPWLSLRGGTQNARANCGFEHRKCRARCRPPLRGATTVWSRNGAQDDTAGRPWQRVERERTESAAQRVMVRVKPAHSESEDPATDTPPPRHASGMGKAAPGATDVEQRRRAWEQRRLDLDRFSNENYAPEV